MDTSYFTRIGRDIQRQGRLSAEVARTQVQIATSKKFAARSDAPVATARIAGLSRSIADSSVWQDNVKAGLARNAEADTVAKSIANQVARARELTVQGANDALTASDRSAIALELAAIADEIGSLAATTASDGAPLFAQGNPLDARYGDNQVFAAVPGRSAFGGTAIEDAVRDARTAVQSGNRPTLDASLAALDVAIGQVANASADIGARGARLEAIGERLARAEIDLRAEKSGLEDTDLSEAIARLNQQMLTLDAARAAFARINRETLFDILR